MQLRPGTEDTHHDFVAAWQAWHRDREAEETAAQGSLALVAATELPDNEPTRLDDAPGTWRREGDRVFLHATARDGLTLGGEVVDGTVEVLHDGAPDARAVEGRGLRAMYVQRGSQRAVRVWRADARSRADFRAIETFPPDPRWVIPAEYTPTEGRVYAFGMTGRDDEGVVPSPGVLAFAVAGRAVTLPVYVRDERRLRIIFADATRGVSVHAPVRSLWIPLPGALVPGADAPGRVDLDFNRTTLMPCCFSPHFTCPVPPATHVLPVAIEAGERGVLLAPVAGAAH